MVVVCVCIMIAKQREMQNWILKGSFLPLLLQPLGLHPPVSEIQYKWGETGKELADYTTIQKLKHQFKKNSSCFIFIRHQMLVNM